MKHYSNQLECKDLKSGEILLNGPQTDNVLLFVMSGTLLFGNRKSHNEIKLKEGYFILLAATSDYKAMAITQSHILILHAGNLSELLVNDPEWNPEKPVVLPILPALKQTLEQIEYLLKNNYLDIN